jgi:hypothetical protein
MDFNASRRLNAHYTLKAFRPDLLALGELRLTLDTLSHYSPVFIAPLAINSLRRRVAIFSGRSAGGSHRVELLRCEGSDAIGAKRTSESVGSGLISVLLRQLREQQSHFSSDAVATSREGHRLPVSNRGGQRRRWGRGRLPFVQIESAPRPLTQRNPPMRAAFRRGDHAR